VQGLRKEASVLTPRPYPTYASMLNYTGVPRVRCLSANAAAHPVGAYRCFDGSHHHCALAWVVNLGLVAISKTLQGPEPGPFEADTRGAWAVSASVWGRDHAPTAEPDDGVGPEGVGQVATGDGT
jgi:hypothetical protein